MRAARAALVLAGACGGCGPSAADFVGTWQFAAGAKLTSTCAGGNADLAGRNFMLVAGVASDLEMPDGLAPMNNCKLTFSVGGSTAEADPGQQCPVTLVGSGCPAVMGATVEYPFTLELDGDALVVDQQWSALVGANGCTAQQCSGAVTGTASKVE